MRLHKCSVCPSAQFLSLTDFLKQYFYPQVQCDFGQVHVQISQTIPNIYTNTAARNMNMHTITKINDTMAKSTDQTSHTCPHGDDHYDREKRGGMGSGRE